MFPDQGEKEEWRWQRRRESCPPERHLVSLDINLQYFL